ncbi:MAG: isochorismatase family protein [Bacteroidales bacterium]|nr:isochorismatase family protein [Bacteroidales bacterium]
MISSENLIPDSGIRRVHIVVDVLNDFISGSMACLHAQEAVSRIIERINAHPQEVVLYVCDAHPINHCSFMDQGGPWPIHCVKHSFGQAIDLALYTRIQRSHQRPRISENIFEKGRDADQEEYSGYHAVCHHSGKTLRETIGREKTVLISGIATEFCVYETVSELIKDGFQVEVLQEGLAYVTLEGHKQALAQMKEMGVRVV